MFNGFGHFHVDSVTLLPQHPLPASSLYWHGPEARHLIKKKFCLLLFEGTFISFFKYKKSKRSHKTVRIKDFFYYFCLMIEGPGSGSKPLTNGSGSGSRRQKNIRILRIRIRIWIRIWIRIRNTDFYKSFIVCLLRGLRQQNAYCDINRYKINM